MEINTLVNSWAMTNACCRPFRRLDPVGFTPLFSTVNRLEKGSVYVAGNVHDLHKFTGWSADSVLYLGDHVYADLADASQQLGWRTGAIIPELERELAIICSSDYQVMLSKNAHIRGGSSS